MNLKLLKEIIENKMIGLINDVIKYLEIFKIFFKNDMENKVKVLFENFDSEVFKLISFLLRVMY